MREMSFSCWSWEIVFFLPFTLFHLPVLHTVSFMSLLYLMLSFCQKLLYTATNGRVCTCVSEWSKGRVCVCYLPMAAPRNNCPECSFCLVIVCSYLPSCCTEKKWLSNIMLSLTAQAWISSNKWSLAFGPIAVFIKSNFCDFFSSLFSLVP